MFLCFGLQPAFDHLALCRKEQWRQHASREHATRMFPSRTPREPDQGPGTESTKQQGHWEQFVREANEISIFSSPKTSEEKSRAELWQPRAECKKGLG